MHTDYTGQGVDQLQQVIDTIKKDPHSRRIVLTAWNPKGNNNYNNYPPPFQWANESSPHPFAVILS